MPALAFDRLLEPMGACLTPEVAARIAAAKADPALAARLETLAMRHTEGQLSPDEFAEYESYVRGLTFVGALQLRARAVAAATPAT